MFLLPSPLISSVHSDDTGTTHRQSHYTTPASTTNTMPFKTLTQALALSLAIAPAASNCDQLHALVYRGPTASEGLPESLRDLLVASHPNINVTFAGPNEHVKINAESLSHVDILAQPGGPGAQSMPVRCTHRSVQFLTQSQLQISKRHGKKRSHTPPTSAISSQAAVDTWEFASALSSQATARASV